MTGMDKKQTRKEKVIAIAIAIIALGMLIPLLWLLATKALPSFVDNAQTHTHVTSAKRVEAETIKGNTCVTDVIGVDTTDGYTVQYKMKGDDFTIDCYNELVTDMNSQTYIDFMFEATATNAHVEWNGKRYQFIKPSPDFVVTENNVRTLLEEIQ